MDFKKQKEDLINLYKNIKIINNNLVYFVMNNEKFEDNKILPLKERTDEDRHKLCTDLYNSFNGILSEVENVHYKLEKFLNILNKTMLINN